MGEEAQAVWFENHFRCGLEYVKNQKVGVARDYKIIHRCIDSPLQASDIQQFVEFKCDHTCAKTGNLYLEYEQTFNYGMNYQPSGMVLAVDQSAFIVFSVKYAGCIHHYVFPSDAMRLLLTRKLRSVRTHPNKNGNPNGCWTNGFLLPVKSIPVSFRQTERISDQTLR